MPTLIDTHSCVVNKFRTKFRVSCTRGLLARCQRGKARDADMSRVLPSPGDILSRQTCHDSQILALACHLGRRKTSGRFITLRDVGLSSFRQVRYSNQPKAETPTAAHWPIIDNNNNNNDDVVVWSFWEAGYSALTVYILKFKFPITVR